MRRAIETRSLKGGDADSSGDPLALDHGRTDERLTRRKGAGTNEI